MKIREFLRDERGIETQVLVFILGAVILVMLITLVATFFGKADLMVDKAMNATETKMNESLAAL